ncbi:MAG: hypothetical protein NTY34_08645 [Candidatus Omnitrophica bacterium]|nr:hypothetical protein [Candidatus Omnitrophota bacterium]
MIDIKLPSLAEGVDKASIFSMPSPLEGKIKELLVGEGDSALVGQSIAIIE